MSLNNHDQFRFIRNILMIAAVLMLTENLFAAKPLERSQWEETIIQDNITISNMFDGLAEGLDMLLIGKKISSKPNETSVKLESRTYSMEGQRVRSTGDISVNLRLPNLEEYWQLKFTSYDEQEDSRGVTRNYLGQNQRERDYGATLGFFRQFGRIRTSFKPRLSLGDPLKLAHSLSFESVADEKDYQINPRLELFAHPDKGTGVFQAINFNFLLSKYFSMTFINEGEYQEEGNLFTATNGFALGQILNTSESLSYNLFFTSENRGAYHMKNFNLSVAWNKLVYKRILDYQIIPNLDFSKERSFKGRAGITLNINVNF